MSDLISRQAAIEAFEAQLDYLRMLNKNENPTAEGKWYGVNWARNTIADLPSAQKRGEWIKINKYDKESNVQCSVCLEDFDYIDGVCYLCHGYELPLFCPNCGSDMRKEVE